MRTLPRISPAFSKLYKGLNSAQREAVDAIEGPVMVVAGPGTGKTHVLTLRIANILKQTDTPPDGILALTFTEAAAAHMRRRLAAIIGQPAYRVRMHTFHGYCQDVIERYPDDFPRIIGSEPISEIERIDIMRGILEGGSWREVVTFGSPLYFLPSMLSSIASLKRENCTPAALKSYIEEQEVAFSATPDLYHEKGAHKGAMKAEHQRRLKLITRTKEFASVYEKYEAQLRTRKRYDFEDMIMEVVAALASSPELRLRLQEESLYILADEHQDANAAQNKLLELISGFHSSPNLCIVGDERQAIFRFQGASLENFAHFKRLFPDARLITLTESYRSGSEILDAAHSLAQTAHVPLVSRTGTRSEVKMAAFSRPEVERAWVASEAARLTREGVEPSSIAILYRTNKEAEPVARALEAAGVEASVEAGESALRDPEIRRFLTLVRAVARPSDEWILRTLHLNFLRIPPLAAYKAAQYARRHSLTLADVIRSGKLCTAAGVEGDELTELYRKLAEFASAPGSVPQILERMVRESGFLEYALSSSNPPELLEKLGWLWGDVEVLASGKLDYGLADFVRDLDLFDEHDVSVRKEKRAAPRPGAVRLMTAHRAKGLEFEYVFIVQAADGVWGGRRESKFFLLPDAGVSGSDEDERRLLYVALTRGKIAVCLTFSRESESGRDRLRSRLLEDVNPGLLQTVDVEEFERRFVPQALRPKEKPPTSEHAYLRELFDEQGLSATGLNQYLECPWMYFYSTLISIPTARGKHMILGEAAHEALKRLVAEHVEGKKSNAKKLVTWYRESLARKALSRGEYEELLERGSAFLSGWFASAQLPRHAKTEYKLRAELPLSERKTVSLLGKLDRMDYQDDGSVIVIDYKTGKPKSRNALLGKTADVSAAANYRQLVFYALLLELDGTQRARAVVLEFLQPDARGAYHREVFEIPSADIEELKATIARAAEDIRTLSFWGSTCGKKGCEYCALRQLTGAREPTL